MRILFLEDDGLTDLAAYVRANGDEPLVLRTGAYDEWHAREDLGAVDEVVQLPRDADVATLVDAAARLRPDALVSLALLDPYVTRDAAIGAALRTTHAIPMVANTPEAAAVANDKDATRARLAACGLAVIEGVEVDDCGQAIAAAERLGFPVVLKRLDGYSGMGMRLFDDAAQLETWYRRSTGPMLVESFVEGLELSVDVLSWGGDCRALSIVSKGETNRDLRRHPIYRLRLAPHPLPDVIARRVRALAEQAVHALGLNGVAECEMILDRRHGPRVLEVNPRISGTLRLSASASGIDPHRCLVDMVRGEAWQHAPRRAPAVVAQVPLGDAIEGDERARLAMQTPVRHIKDIDWMPGLGVRASVTVQAPDPDALCDWLQGQARYPGFTHAAVSVRELFDAQPSLLQESAT